MLNTEVRPIIVHVRSNTCKARAVATDIPHRADPYPERYAYL